MKPIIRVGVLVAAIGALAIVLAACGSSSSSSVKPAITGYGQNLSNGKRGGTLTDLQHIDFQHLDPGESYFAGDYPVIYATQRPLFDFPPNSATAVVPDLASGPAIISPDGKTVTVHIRHGVHFSPPVNREVTSADVAYGIERGANPNVANPYFPSYYFDVVGGSSANGGPIAGLSTPDRYTIVFHLTGPYGTFFADALTLPLSAPVPKEYAAPLDAKKPTQYGLSKEVATGPYMLKSDSSGKFIGIGYQPGKSLTLVRNPNWNASTDYRPAYLDQININIGGDENVIGRQVLTGSHMVENEPPAASIVKLAYQHYYNQLVGVPGAGDFYVGLNNAYGPFRNVNLRRAVWAAVDRVAILKAAGGRVAGTVGTHFIYPTSIGYDLAGGDHGPNVDYNNYPTGNLTVAAKYMKLAGYPSGRYTGSATIKVVGANGDPAGPQAAIVNQALQSLGFKTNFNTVEDATMYSKYCGVAAAKIDVCPSVGWIRDWADPQTVLDTPFAGYNIVASNNSNWSLANYQDWPKAAGGTYTGGPLTPIDQAMRAGEKTVGTQARAVAWAKIDRMLVDQAVAVPTYFVIEPEIQSRDVRGINQLWNQGSWDYSFTSLK